MAVALAKMPPHQGANVRGGTRRHGLCSSRRVTRRTSTAIPRHPIEHEEPGVKGLPGWSVPTAARKISGDHGRASGSIRAAGSRRGFRFAVALAICAGGVSRRSASIHRAGVKRRSTGTFTNKTTSYMRWLCAKVDSPLAKPPASHTPYRARTCEGGEVT